MSGSVSAAVPSNAEEVATPVRLGAMLAVRDSVGLNAVSIEGFTAQAINLALLAILFGALSAGIGAATGTGRATLFGLTAGAGVLSYAVHGFAPQIGADWLRQLTPYHYYIGGEPLKNGIQYADAGILAAATTVLITAGAWRFSRRDLC